MNFKGLNVLYYDSKKIILSNIIWGLLQLGAEVERSKLLVTMNTLQEEEVIQIRKEIVKYNCVVSQNFSVNIALACYEECVPYISWVYDSPLPSLYAKYSQYPTNFIFSFDKLQVSRLKECGVENVFHMPLAANIAYTSGISVSNKELQNFSSDVTFIGQLYRLDYVQKYLKDTSQENLREIDNLTDRLSFDWKSRKSIFGVMSGSLVDSISIREEDFNFYDLFQERFIKEAVFLGPMIANREREGILRLCGSMFKTSLYTAERDLEYAKNCFPNVRVKGPVSQELPYKIYASSKLNLNVTLRTIETGVPQRVFDIMSMGGTVISNYQEEAEELFVPDKEIILFETLDEFTDKAKFYLNHASLRKKIGEAGYKKVRDKYNYTYALNKMFDIVMEIIG